VSEPAARDGKLVLVVDDEPDVRTSLSLILRMEGYRVIAAAQGQVALELIEEEVPDIVLTDFMMPWMNGRELIREIRRRDATRHVPAIIMSGVTPGEPELWDAYLRKPMEIAGLLNTIERLLRAGAARGSD
jgi:CheY-like chemotaxis protein